MRVINLSQNQPICLSNLFVVLCFSFFAWIPIDQLFGQDTFSIIAADPETGEIGAAGASCVDGIEQFNGIKILNKIIPGRGGVNAQAWICINPHRNLDLAIELMEEGMSPEEILNHLMENDACGQPFGGAFNPEYRQYGILDFGDNDSIRVVAFSGSETDDYKGHIVGPNYSVQGNILLGPEVLEAMAQGFGSTTGSLAHKLMGAMQGANMPGADQRCLDRGTSSTSAFLTVYGPDDDPNEPSLLLDILEMPFGEEPIDSLQILFDEWLLSSAVSLVDDKLDVRVFPNPSESILYLDHIDKFEIKQIQIFNHLGKLIKEYHDFIASPIKLNIEDLESGLHYIEILNKDKTSNRAKFIKLK